MQIATIWLRLDETLRSNVRKTGITPGQALILRKMFGKKLPGQAKPTIPFDHLEITAESSITNSDEYARLTHIYGEKTVSSVFPGDNVTLPQTFKQVGLEETEQSEPMTGKKHDIETLSSVPRGLSEGEATDSLELLVQQQKKQIEELTALVKASQGQAPEVLKPVK